MSSFTKDVSRYRIFCNTESNNIYAWGTSAPTTCPNNPAHSINSNLTTVVDSVSKNNVIIENVTRAPYGEWRVAEKTLVIELKSCAGKSTLRDIDVVTGTGTISNNVGDPEYTLTTSGSNDSTILYSAERGRYISGIGAEVGIGIRIPNPPTGNQVYRWGMFDSNDGFFFQLNTSGLACVIRRNGSDNIVPNAQFNGDWSSIQNSWHPDDGFIYNIMFSWYGYGSVNFIIQNKPNIIHPYTRIHTFDPTDQTSIKNPNLPVCASITNGGTTGTGRMFVAGRQYSVIGKYVPIYRLNASYRSTVSINSTTVFIPILSIRRKNGFNGIAVKVSGMDLIGSTNQIVQLRTGATLTGASWSNLPNQLSSETVMENDLSATAMTGGAVIWTGIISQDRSAVQKLEDFTFVLSEYNPVTVCAMGISQINGTATCCLRFSEEW